MANKGIGYGKNHYFGDAFDRRLYSYSGWSNCIDQKASLDHRFDDLKDSVKLHFVSGEEVLAVKHLPNPNLYVFKVDLGYFTVPISKVSETGLIRIKDIAFALDVNITAQGLNDLYFFVFSSECFQFYTKTMEPVKVAHNLGGRGEILVLYKGKVYKRTLRAIGTTLFKTIEEAKASNK